MFALEIIFADGVSQPEMIYVRRPQALIGASDYAHVVVEDLKGTNVQLRLVRDLGRRFRVKPLGGDASSIEMSSLLEGVYEGEASLDLGPVRMYFTSLDTDLQLKEGEPPDRAGVRVLRQACAHSSPLFPALAIGGSNPMIVSFVPDQPIYVGRSKQCPLRLDAADISAKHARIGFESGEFWVEDLGSTNGTFVNKQQISGRMSVPAGTPIILGREISITGILSADQIDRAAKSIRSAAMHAPQTERKYPVLFSVSEVARPARVVMSPGTLVAIGRDPGSEMWLGAPHVSRKHCEVSASPTGAIVVSDYSTNGTAHDRGLLHRGDVLDVNGEPCVLDFGGGITVSICFNEEQEKQFVESQGSPQAFRALAGSETRLQQLEYPGTDSGSRVGGKSATNLPIVLQLYRSLNWTGKASILFLIAFLGACVVILAVAIGGLF